MVQAYHNELVSKVSRLEEENIMLKKEKVQDLIHVFCFPQYLLLVVSIVETRVC